MAIVCRGMWALSVTWGRLAVVCRMCVRCMLLEAAWWLSVSCMRQVGCCLQGCMRTLSEIEAEWRLSVSYMRKADGYLSATRGRLAVICQLREAGWWLSVSYMRQVICQLHEPGWRLSVSYMRQDDGYLSVTWGRMTVICRLHGTGWRLSVSYMRQDGDYL
jgi:hypothetical protein